MPYRALFGCLSGSLVLTYLWLKENTAKPEDWLVGFLLVGIPAGVAWWVLFLALRSLKKNRS